MRHAEFKEGDELITTAEAAKIIGVSPRTLEKWRRERPIDRQPQFKRISYNVVKYVKSSVYVWVSRLAA